MAQATQTFLWYNRKDKIKDEDLKHIPQWEKEGFILSEAKLIEEIKEEVLEIPIDNVKDSVVDRLKDIAKDLLDDGKLNKSNKKKSNKKK